MVRSKTRVAKAKLTSTPSPGAERKEQEVAESAQAVEEQDAGDLFFFDTEPTTDKEPPAAPAPVQEEEEEDIPGVKEGRRRGRDGDDDDGEAEGKGKDKRKKKKKRSKVEVNEEREQYLEKLLFGVQDVASLYGGDKSGVRGGRSAGGDEDRDEEDKSTTGGEGANMRPAWADEDDAEVTVSIAQKNRLRKLRKTEEEDEISAAEYEKRLRSRFLKSTAGTSWADLPTDGKEARGDGASSDEEQEGAVEEEDELFRSAANLVIKSRGRLPPGRIDIARCPDANIQEPSKAVVQVGRFHKNGSLFLTAGLDKTLRLFNIDGLHNPKAQGVFFPDLPIQSAAFTGAEHTHVVVSGRRPYFYWYDLASGEVGKVPGLLGRKEKSLEKFVASPDGQWLAFHGNNGYVILASAKSRQWAGDFKMSGSVNTACFSPDGMRLLASGTDAAVYMWDIRSSRCLCRFDNEGGTATTSLATCGGATTGYTVVGAESGVVNIYDNASLQPLSDVKPVKALLNLTTSVDNVVFNPDTQVLAMSSRLTRDALKLVHLPSMSVFSNWPTAKTPIRYPFTMDFSPNGGYFTVGNDRGQVLLYRLKHYGSA